MNRNKTILSVKPDKKKLMAPTALALAAIMGVTTIMTTPVYAANTKAATEESADTSESSSDSSDSENASDSKVTKDETVYVVADAKGNKKKVTVSDQLKGAGDESSVKDSSTLSDIENTKGDETFDGSGDDMTWSTAGEDIYYQGKSDEDLPVNATFTYYLDGEEIDPKDLVGKSGKVTIDIEYTNNTSAEITVDGKKVNTKVPFVMATALFMPSEKFSNITIDNGKIIDDGSKSIVVGFGMPGLSEALDLDNVKNKSRELDADNLKNLDDATVPESVEITADVENFELESTYTIATSDVFSDVDFSDVSSLSDIDSKVNELEDATLKLVDGSKELSDGTSKLKTSYADMDKGIGDLQKGIKAYTDGVSEAQEGANKLSSGLAQLDSNSSTLINGATDLSNGINQIYTGLNSGINQYTEGAGKAVDGIDQVNDGINQLYAGLAANGLVNSDVNQQLEAIKSGSSDNAINAQVTALNSQVSQLVAGVDELCNSTTASAAQLQELDKQLGTLIVGLNGVNTYINNIDSTIDTISSKTKNNTNLSDESKNAVDTALSQVKGVVDVQTDAEGKVVASGGYTTSQKITGMINQLTTAKTELDNKLKYMSDNAEKIQQLKTSVDSLQSPENITKVNNIANGLKALADGVPQLKVGSNKLASEASGLTNKESLSKIQYGIDKLGKVDPNDGQKSALEGVNDLNAGINKYTGFVHSASVGASELANGKTSLATLKANSSKLNSGATKLKSGSTQVSDGIAKLSDGANTLSDGMSQYYDEAIKPIVNSLSSLSGTGDRLEALKNGDLSYTNFSGISDDMTGSVKFVFTTESLKADKE